MYFKKCIKKKYIQNMRDLEFLDDCVCVWVGKKFLNT